MTRVQNRGAAVLPALAAVVLFCGESTAQAECGGHLIARGFGESISNLPASDDARPGPQPSALAPQPKHFSSRLAPEDAPAVPCRGPGCRHAPAGGLPSAPVTTGGTSGKPAILDVPGRQRPEPKNTRALDVPSMIAGAGAPIPIFRPPEARA